MNKIIYKTIGNNYIIRQKYKSEDNPSIMTINDLVSDDAQDKIRHEQLEKYNKIMSMDISYEQKLVKIASLGTVKHYTEKENLAIVQELNEGMYEFILADRKIKVESEIGLPYIYINQ
jgi:hypothetical protein